MLPASFLSVMHKIITDFRGDHDLVALPAKSLCDEFFTASVSVGVGRIEQRDAQIKRLVHQRDRISVRVISPPTGRNRPQAEPHFAHPKVRSSKVTILHSVHRMPLAPALCHGFRGSNRSTKSLAGGIEPFPAILKAHDCRSRCRPGRIQMRKNPRPAAPTGEKWINAVLFDKLEHGT